MCQRLKLTLIVKRYIVYLIINHILMKISRYILFCNGLLKDTQHYLSIENSIYRAVLQTLVPVVHYRGICNYPQHPQWWGQSLKVHWKRIKMDKHDVFCLLTKQPICLNNDDFFLILNLASLWPGERGMSKIVWCSFIWNPCLKYCPAPGIVL